MNTNLEQFRDALFLEATIGMVVVDHTGNILLANPFCERMFGYKPGELDGLEIESLIPQKYRNTHHNHRSSFQNAPTRREMGTGLKLLGLRKDESTFPVQISLSHTEIGQVRYSIAYVSDDSKRQELLAAMDQSKSSLDRAQRMASIGSFVADVDTGQELWSAQLCEIFDLPARDSSFPGDFAYQYLHPEDREGVRIRFQQICIDQKSTQSNVRIISPEGKLKHVILKREYIKSNDGTSDKIAGLVRDITELVEARNFSDDVSHIIEESLNEIYIIDAASKQLLLVNKGARRKLGYTLQEMKSMQHLKILLNYDEQKYDSFLSRVDTQQQVVFDAKHLRKDGSSYPVEIHLQKSRLGLRPAYIAIALDITERVEYEQALLKHADTLEKRIFERTKELAKSEASLKQALSKERELSELKSRFVSMASHEFRTPLTAILSSANLIGKYEKENQQDKRIKHLNRIESSVRNLNIILNDFLSLEKLETGKIKAKYTQVDIFQLVNHIIDELQATCKPGQHIEHIHEGNQLLFSDEFLLNNMLINLLSNAIKYSPNDGKIIVRSNITDSLLHLSVQDFGIGIPEEDQKHIFTTFFRATNVGAEQGTGLGITIVKRYLDLLGGELTFKSKQDHGTTFTMSIPLARN